jgi:hypothetical protein
VSRHQGLPKPQTQNSAQLLGLLKIPHPKPQTPNPKLNSPQMLGVIFEASETWDAVLSKHLITLRELSRSMREIATQSNAVSLKKAARGDAGFFEGLIQSLVVRAPFLASNFGLDGTN